MANPQTENGFTSISNELLNAFCKIRIPGEARQVLDVIIRKTYGFKKKNDIISCSQFVKATGIKKQHIKRAILKLKNMNIIYQKRVTKKGYAIFTKALKQKTNEVIHRGPQKGYYVYLSYYLNKDYDSWLPLVKKRTVTQKGYNVEGRVTQKGGHKRKIYIKKDIDVNSEAFKIKEYFSNMFLKKYSRPYRFLLKEEITIESLLKTHTKDVILDLIDLFFEEVEVNEWLKTRCNFSMFNHKVNELVIKLSSISNN